MTSPLTVVSVVRRHPREAGVATAGAILVVLAVSAIGWRRSADPRPSAVAQRTPFVETLVESGTISAQRLAVYSSTIPGVQAKIVELAAEGRAVRPGDPLVRFDSTIFEQTRARERASLSQADADLVRAREELRLELLGVEGDIESARQQVGFAETGLKNQIDGRGRLALAEADAAAGEAARELDRAKKTHEDLKPLLAEGFITRAELDRAEQAWRRAEEQKSVADARRETLVQYEQPAATGRAQADVHVARNALTRQTETAAARANERRAAVAAMESRVQEIRTRVAMLDDQINRTLIRASTPGLVVYRDLFFGTDRRKPQVGDEVWPNQPIIALPDSSQLTVETRVREIDLHKVSDSQHVQVRVDAYPDLKLSASVTLVGALAQDDQSRAGTKFFPVTIRLHGTDPRLRTGMTARVEIEVLSLPAAVVIPVQAVFGDKGQIYVVVPHGDRPERRAITIAAENESFAAVATGLTAGTTVLLVDPTVASPAK
jgi:HlyD family secretion protein